MSDSITFDSASKVANDIFSHVPGSTGGTNIFSAFRDFFGAQGDLAKFYSNISTGTGLSGSAFKPAQTYYFRTNFTFTPAKSIVFNRLRTSFLDTSAEVTKFLVRKADLPNFTLQKYKNPLSSELFEHEMGFMGSPGLALPSSNMFDITFMSTERSLHEYIFYYWMREAAATYWSYDDYPFTTATVTFDFLDAAQNKPYMSYIYTGVYPIDIQTLQPNQVANQDFDRIVKFEFCNFYVKFATPLGNNPLGILYQDLSPLVFK